MSHNVIAIPYQLYAHNLPADYECTLYIGRLVGQSGSREGLWKFKHIQTFSFEIHDVDDETQYVLYYTAWDAVANQLARWANAGDTVGLVVASKGDRIDIMLAYNFSRRRWFSTNYYRHVRDLSLQNRMTLRVFMWVMNILSGVGVLTCGVGLIPMIYLGTMYFKQFSAIHTPGYRLDAATQIETWITDNAHALASSGNASLDPSL